MSSKPLLRALWLVFVLLGTGEESAASCPRFTSLLATWNLPNALAQARDLRWFRPDLLLVVSSRYGVVEVRLSERPELGDILLGTGSGGETLRLPMVLAVSGDQWLAGGWYRGRAHAVLWKKRESEALAGLDPDFAEILDLDAHQGKVAILAPRLNPAGRLLRNAALAWQGRLVPGPRETLADLDPVFYSADGPKIMSFINCSIMDLGVTRFLHDGSLLVVPHFEEGIFLYDTEGQLRRTWTSRQADFDAACPLTTEEADRLALDEPGRWRWNAGRRIVDDILPLPDGRAALLIREVENGNARWRMAVLDPENSSVATCPLTLPGGETLTSGSHLARLKVDIHEDRVAFLVRMDGPADHELRTEPPRLLVLELE